MEDTLSKLAGYSLRRASAAMQAEFAVLLQPMGLRPTDASMLVIIGANPGISQSTLGQSLAVQRANMVPLIARLEENGYIARKALDGRSFGLSLTPSGEETCDQVAAVMDLHQQRIMDRIPEMHREHLVPALRCLWE
jgi:DNA-binding MarR family transcriptional regulator